MAPDPILQQSLLPEPPSKVVSCPEASLYAGSRFPWLWCKGPWGVYCVPELGGVNGVGRIVSLRFWLERMERTE